MRVTGSAVVLTAAPLAAAIAAAAAASPAPPPGGSSPCHEESRLSMGCTCAVRVCGLEAAESRAATAAALDEARDYLGLAWYHTEAWVPRFAALVEACRRASPVPPLRTLGKARKGGSRSSRAERRGRAR